MSTLSVTLRCLRHPVTTACIALLLVNDHWLKSTCPSWWTGKLSDFAGLFFFPFLLTAFLGLLLTHVSPQDIAKIAFGLTALWFTCFKVLPPVNDASNVLLGSLLGHPVQLLLDPTDLIALPVLMPAWHLWNRQAAAPVKTPDRRAWFALVTAALATAATAPAPSALIIQNLDQQGGKLYFYGRDPSLPYSTSLRILGVSEDSGRTSTGVVPSDLTQVSSRQPTQDGCDPLNAQVCYHLGPELVLQSTDGGRTYQVAWSIPWGRRFFMQRENETRALSSEKRIDMGPYDLIFMQPANANGLSTVVFAMGNEGVLVHTPEGAWERYAVYTAGPTPFSARDWYDAFRTAPAETDIAALLIIVLFTLVSFRAAFAFRRIGSRKHSVLWAIWPLVAFDLLFLLSWGIWASLFPHFGPFAVAGLGVVYAVVGPFAIIPMLVIPLLFFWVWRRIAQLAPNTDMAAPALRRTVIITLGMVLATWGVLLLWAAGIIPLYEIAVGFAIVLALAVMIVGIILVPGTLPAAQNLEKT